MVNIDRGGQINAKYFEANRLQTVHSNGSAFDELKNAISIEEGGNDIGIYYWDKEEAISLIRPGQATGLGRSLKNGFINSIRDVRSPVKLSKLDVNEISQFRRWFKGSKIVNSDGTPKIMYHGTPYGVFTTFKDWQYFTDNKEAIRHLWQACLEADMTLPPIL